MSSLRRLWAGERTPATMVLAVLTAPLSALFGTVVRVRNALYDLGALSVTPPPLPVISVGNLTVGGTGKTPVVAWLARKLEERGWCPAVVLRGYGEDEVLLHRRWNPDVPVIRAPDRRAGVREAVEKGRDVVLLDDGFQHRRIGRTVDVVLLSPAQPLPARLLPRGPFREPLRALRRADLVVVTAKGAHEAEAAAALARELALAPGGPTVELLTFRMGAWQDLDGNPATLPEGPPLVVCSVGEPTAFVRAVESRMGEGLDVLVFPDHHDFQPEDADRIAHEAAGRWTATTEKDAVKLSRLREHLPAVRVLPLVPEPGDRISEVVTRLLGESDSAVSKGRAPDRA